MKNKINFDLWNEGYAATGEYSPAIFLGTFEAECFEDACDKWAETLCEREKDLYKREGSHAVFWGCRIYDNEEDARKLCG